ncbi:uncharacterized protein LOC144622918 isoform X1 [Crassostrea virginica]
MPARVYIAYILLCIFNGIYSMNKDGACNGDPFVLNSCEGRIISNRIINVDFHFVKDKCSCVFESNVSLLYYLSNYPRFDCGTGINITKSDSTTRILQCASDSTTIGSINTNLATKVQMSGEIISEYRNEDYCLSVFSNNLIDSVDGPDRLNNLLSTLNFKPLNSRPSRNVEQRAGSYAEAVTKKSMQKTAKGSIEIEM